jgi:membrane protein YqaA with SNARE-associated domain
MIRMQLGFIVALLLLLPSEPQVLSGSLVGERYVKHRAYSAVGEVGLSGAVGLG